MTTVSELVAVVDIGKSNVKVALVDLAARAEVALKTTPNRVRSDGAYPHHDVETLWTFILEALAALVRQHRIDAISVTTHGATAALLNAGGSLALPVLDYEFAGPDSLRADYEAIRPPFAESGTPPLPLGLNLGAQIFWQSRRFPADFARVSSILMYPQYWGFRLTGVRANEATSLGCHTDLWSPAKGDFASMVHIQGWHGLFAPVRPADAVLGRVLPEIAERTGLASDTRVLTGLHDSNASLLPHLIDRRPPFAVVSTGTWVIAMAIGGRAVRLDPARDTLVNVNAFGDAVPSARFMGGREFETAMRGTLPEWTKADLQAVLAAGTMLLPSMQQGSGPFPLRQATWIGEPQGERRFVATSFYLALMTATCLDLIGAEGEIVIEGPLARNGPYASMLAAATGRAVIADAGHATGTSIGAALLLGGASAVAASAPPEQCGDRDELWRYALLWRARVGASAGNLQ